MHVVGDKVGISVQDFEKISTRNLMYIDKTAFIRDWWETGDDVTLITRLEHCGKIFMLSIVECFFQAGIRIDMSYLTDLRYEIMKSIASCSE